jgi:hypothetical protein
MSWQSLLHAQKIKSDCTSLEELSDLRDLVERHLQDACRSGAARVVYGSTEDRTPPQAMSTFQPCPLVMDMLK